MKIKDLPLPIKEVALQRQREAGEEADEEIDMRQSLDAFDWWGTPERGEVWANVNNGNYEPFYALYPDKRPKSAHDLYNNKDADAPKFIKDPNGDVILDLCKNCGKAESDLTDGCTKAVAPWEPKTGELVNPHSGFVCPVSLRPVIFLFKHPNGKNVCVESGEDRYFHEGKPFCVSYWDHVSERPPLIEVTKEDIASWKGCKPEQIKIV